MRIYELLEGNIGDLSNFVKHGDGKNDIDYDIAEDMMHYMNNNDRIYRRYMYPIVEQCIRFMKLKKSTGPEMFKGAVQECYDSYLTDYPIRELPNDLDDSTCKAICKKIYEQLCKDIEEGKYKD